MTRGTFKTVRLKFDAIVKILFGALSIVLWHKKTPVAAVKFYRLQILLFRNSRWPREREVRHCWVVVVRRSSALAFKMNLIFFMTGYWFLKILLGCLWIWISKLVRNCPLEMKGCLAGIWVYLGFGIIVLVPNLSRNVTKANFIGTLGQFYSTTFKYEYIFDI